MNRRDFLKRMALAGLAVASPKIIFDMGKNAHRNECAPADWTWIQTGSAAMNPLWENAEYEEIIISGTQGMLAPTGSIVNPTLYPRRFVLDEAGNMIQVLPFTRT